MMNKLLLYLKGIAIGMTDVIPGISGATTAILLGVYDTMIQSANAFSKAIKDRQWSSAINACKILVPLFLGVLTGLVLFAKIIKFLLYHWPIETQLAFVGLIIGSLPSFVIQSKLLPINFKKILWFIIGALAMTAILVWDSKQISTPANHDSLLPTLSQGYIIKLIFIGLIVSIATALPGISGSLILLLMGEYYHVLAVLNYWLDNIMQGKMIWSAFFSLAGFATGLAIGLLSYAVIVAKILEKYRSELFSFAFGLILFSLAKIWPNSLISLQQGVIVIAFALLPLLNLLGSKAKK